MENISDSNETCKGCKRQFAENSLLRHVGKAKKCKAAYGDDYELLKKEKTLAYKAR